MVQSVKTFIKNMMLCIGDFDSLLTHGENLWNFNSVI